jgi:ATP-dependent protease HslVU (ClpYQ) peptidase subunit
MKFINQFFKKINRIMTCIVGLIDKENKKVLLGGDSSGISGWDLNIRKDPKVFINGSFIIGGTTSYRMLQLLNFSFKPPEIKTDNIYEYMCTDFVNAIRNCFKDGSYLQKETKGDETGGTFLVAHNDRLFKIGCDFQVGETLNGMDSVGCGSSYALGSLYTTEKLNMKPKDRVIKSLECATAFSCGVYKPFIVLST